MIDHLNVVGFVVLIVECCGILVIAIEAIRTVIRYLIGFLGLHPLEVDQLRIRLGRGMIMGLEFLVAADILKTALAPTWNSMLLLASLIALRTVLNWLLEWELKALCEYQPSASEE